MYDWFELIGRKPRIAPPPLLKLLLYTVLEVFIFLLKSTYAQARSKQSLGRDLENKCVANVKSMHLSTYLQGSIFLKYEDLE